MEQKKFGYFQKDGAEFVIDELMPPRPQLNYIWNDSILSGINHMGGGIGAYGDRATAYIDPDGKGRCTIVKNGHRYFYVKDADTGDFWNPGWYPVRKDALDYSCTHGLGYSIIQSKRDGVRAKLRMFINDTDPVEIWTVTLLNESDKAKNIKFYAFSEFILSGYPVYCNYYSNVFGRFNETENTLVAYNEAQERTHKWFNVFLASSTPVTGFDTSKRKFIGVYGDVTAPKALLENGCTNSLAACEDLVGALEHTFNIPAGGEISFHVLLGACDGMDTAVYYKNKIFTPGKIEKDFEKLLLSKQKMIHDIEVTTPDEAVNNITNKWVKQQVQLCAEAGRDTGKGFRDQLQDAWAIASFNANMAKEKILETLRYQYSDGKCVRGWLPLDNHIYSDGPTWIPPTINAYVKETGDTAFLDITVPYLDEGEATVWEHILKAVRFLCRDLGAHNLVLARAGDWNDSLNGIGKGGKGESVWTSIATVNALHNAAELAVLRGETDVKDELLREAVIMDESINANGWDGEYYLAGYDDEGRKVGTHTEAEGSIYLNSQTWGIMTGVAKGERLESCLKALDEKLDSPYGPLTLYPTYTKYNPAIGRLTGMVPGIWENGTPYCHGGSFKIVSDCLLGRGNEAYTALKKIMPDNPDHPSSVSGCEPYALTNMYFGPDNPRAGDTMFAWVTGTAGWIFRSVTQYMMGFHPGHGTIKIMPAIPSHWDKCTMKRKFRGDTYDMTIYNPNGGQSKIEKIFVDGNRIEGNEIGLFEDGGMHTIEVHLN